MIEYITSNKNLAVSLLLSALFFLGKGIQYAVIGSFIPLVIIISFLVLLALSLRERKKGDTLILRVWAILLIIWSILRIVISIIHNTIRPFDGSLHLTQQFSITTMILSILMLILGTFMFRSLNKTKEL